MAAQQLDDLLPEPLETLATESPDGPGGEEAAKDIGASADAIPEPENETGDGRESGAEE